MPIQLSVPLVVDDEDFKILGDDDEERAEQLKILVSSNLGELIRFYKFINTIHTPTIERNTKGNKAPKDSPKQGDGAQK